MGHFLSCVVPSLKEGGDARRCAGPHRENWPEVGRSLARPRFGQVSLTRFSPASGGRCRPEVGVPSRPRHHAGLKALTGRTGRRSLHGRALRRSALSPRLVLGNRERAFATPDPHDRHALRLAAIDDPKGRPDQFTRRTLAELRDNASKVRQILEESDAVQNPLESPLAGRCCSLSRVPEPQLFQVANG